MVSNLEIATKIILQAINSKPGITKSDLGKKFFERRYELLLGSGSKPWLLFEGLVIEGKIKVLRGDTYELTPAGKQEFDELPELPESITPKTVE